MYIVYPLIQESEKLDLKNLEDGYNAMCEVFPDIKIDFLHGKMTPAEKDERMARFKSGQTGILMSTTVIEVGVDVPNASVMVIESAERFGLSHTTLDSASGKLSLTIFLYKNQNKMIIRGYLSISNLNMDLRERAFVF